MRGLISISACFLLLLSLKTSHAWHRDLTLETLPDCHHDYLQPNNAVVEDVIPIWPGKEIIQATYEHIYIIKADNSDMMTLDIPDVQPNPPHPTTVWGDYAQWAQCWQLGAGCGNQVWHEFITGVPAAGDVDNDDLKEIVVGITNTFPFLGPCIPGPFNPDCPSECIGCPLDITTITNCFSTLVWWKWNGTTFTRHTYDVYQELGIPLYLATPVIARTGMTNGDPTVIFYGPTEWIQPQFEGSDVSLQVSSFDLRDPNNPQISISNHFGPIDAGGYDIGAGGPFCVQAGDFNGDGLDEFITHTSRVVYAWEWTNDHWDFLTGFDAYVPPSGWSFFTGSFALADVEADGSLDILAPSTQCNINQCYSKLRQIDRFGDQIQQFGPLLIETGTSKSIPAVADWSSLFPASQSPGALNPLMQILAFTDAYLPSGERLSSWPVSRYYQHAGSMYVSNMSSPVVGDIADSGYAQILDATIGRVTPGLNELCAYDPRNVSTPVVQLDLDVAIPDYDDNMQTPSVPAIVDADGDGQTEVVVTYRTGESTMRVFSEDFPGEYRRELAEWSQFQNGPKHTGLYAQPVSGNQPRDEMEWSGRIVVHDWYTVQAGQLLHIKPGTVVEFTPGAWLLVDGTLWIGDTDADSVYLKPDGTSDWGGIYVGEGAELGMTRAVVHGAGSIYAECYGGTSPMVTIVDSRIYDMECDSQLVMFDPNFLY